MSENSAAPDESGSVSWRIEQTVFRDVSVGGNLAIGDVKQTTHFHLPPPPKIEPKHFTVPYSRNAFFTGREAILTQLHETLGQTGTAAVSQAKAISGLGGVGKTQIAVEYAYRYFEEDPVYNWVLWVNASNLTLAASFGALVTDLALPNHRENKLNENVAAVLRWLETNDFWLLIFDNVDDLQAVKPFRPKNSRGRILITSRIERLESLGVASSIVLDTMTPAEAQEFLLVRTGLVKSLLIPQVGDFEAGSTLDLSQQTDATGSAVPHSWRVGEQLAAIDPSEQQAIADLAQGLGYLPLALEQSAAYILAKKVSFATYLRTYQKRRLQLLEKQKPQMGDYPDSVATTWTINFEAVKTSSPAAADLLSLSAFLAPDNIPYELLIRGQDHLGELLNAALAEAADDELVLSELLEELTRYSLIRLETDNRYSIHRMVQEVLRDALTPEERHQWIDRVVEALNSTFPDPEFENWGWCNRLVEHVLEIEVKGQPSALISLEELLHQVGNYLYAQGRYGDAEPLHCRTLQIGQTLLGNNHPRIAGSLNSLAGLYVAQGRYKEAEPLFQQALQIQKNAVGDSHPAVLAILTNLASLYRSQGHYEKAKILLQQVLKMRGTSVEGDLSVAKNLNHLAGTYCSQGRYEEAEQLFQQVLQMRQSLLGNNHPDVATSLNNLAYIYCFQGRFTEAEPLYLQVLQMRKVLLGDNHPDVATSLNNLAYLYESQGRDAEAEPLYQQALQRRRVLLGHNHPDVATSLNNLALLYNRQGRYAEAEPLLRKSLQIRETLLGDNHPDIATSLNNLAYVYCSQERYKEAELLYRKALQMMKVLLGDNHPSLAFCFTNLAHLYESQERYIEAESLYQQALQLHKTSLGNKHYEVALRRNNLAVLYRKQGRYTEAESLYLEALAIVIRTLDEDHPDTQNILDNFISCLQQAVAVGQTKQLSNHPLTQLLLKGL